jgi:hypothetical protein
MENFIVKFDPADIRNVLLDGMTIGPTESVLLVATGVYTVTLDGAQNYTPVSLDDASIINTTPEVPLVITFTKTV